MPHFHTVKPQRVLELGSAYAGSSVNTVIFRYHAIVTRGHYQFTGFYLSDRQIALVRRDLRDDSLERHILEGQFNPADVHNCISLGLDPDGYVHIAYDHHGHALHYRRSKEPLSINAWTDMLPMTGAWEDKVTYPHFIMVPNNSSDAEGLKKLLFLYRHLGAGNGDMCLKEYDHKALKWTDLAERFIKGTEQTPWTANAYWNHPAFDAQGNLILTWVWRMSQKASVKADFIFNMHYGYAHSPDGRRWFTSHGVELSLPITPLTAEVIHATTPGCVIANMTSSDVDSANRIHVMGYGSDIPYGVCQYQHIWKNGKGWWCDVISNRETLSNLLTWNPPLSRPEIVIDREDRVYVIFRSEQTGQRWVAQRLDPPVYAPPGKTFLLWDEPVDNAEPMVDHVRWKRDGVLSMLVQKNFQPDLIAKEEGRPEPVRIVEWEF